MQAAVLASTLAMGAAIRRVLGRLHSQKQAAGVDALLLRLYEPIIFRCVQAQSGNLSSDFKFLCCLSHMHTYITALAQHKHALL